ncbi:MAG: hypothetical protein ACLUFU_02240 [Bacilli bacterium]
MKAITRRYLKEKHDKIKFYLTLMLAEFILLDYIYSNEIDIIKLLYEITNKNEFSKKEKEEIIKNALKFLLIKYNLDLTNLINF